MSSPVLSVSHLQKKFGKKVALRNISFHIKSAEIVALLGPNGAGKSTTMKLLLGLRQADGGSIERPEKEDLGYAAQELSFPAHLKTIEVLKLVQSHYQNPYSLKEISQRFELVAYLHRQVGGLSGGEKRRLSLACALMGRPRLLILDEPTTGLDVESRIQLWKEIQTFADDGGAVLLSTHDLNEVAQIAHRVVIIDHGRILFDGPVGDITRRLSFKTVKFKGVVPPNSQYIEDHSSFEDCHQILTQSPESLLKDFYKHEYVFSDLEIHAASLEEAFIHLRKNSHETLP